MLEIRVCEEVAFVHAHGAGFVLRGEEAWEGVARGGDETLCGFLLDKEVPEGIGSSDFAWETHSHADYGDGARLGRTCGVARHAACGVAEAVHGAVL